MTIHSDKTILAFGDSLTWGFEAGTFRRHPLEYRWPTALERELGPGHRVIAEGMNGRTTVYDDPTVPENRNGAAVLPTLLSTHQPLDLVIIMLGTNDVKFAGRCRAFDAARGMNRLVQMVQDFRYNADYATPKVLVVAPPHAVKTTNRFFADLFEHAIEETKLFALHYGALAEELGVGFFDAATVAKADPTDGVHLDRANTAALGRALAGPVRALLA